MYELNKMEKALKLLNEKISNPIHQAANSYIILHPKLVRFMHNKFAQYYVTNSRNINQSDTAMLGMQVVGFYKNIKILENPYLKFDEFHIGSIYLHED